MRNPSPSQRPSLGLDHRQPFERRAVERHCNNTFQLGVKAWHIDCVLPVTVGAVVGHALTTVGGHTREQHTVAASRPLLKAPDGPPGGKAAGHQPVVETFEAGLELPP